jgi:predicted secreted Zn-dependent protease
MNAKRGKVSTKSYSVGGKTLAEINKDMEKKGPVDPNESKRYSGSCLGKIDLSIGADDFAFETTAGSSPVEVTATLKGGSVTSSAVITLPKLASDKGLSAAAKKEWNRFLAKVGVHEEGHADSYYNLAVAMAKEMVEMSAKGTGKDERSAQIAAQKALIAALSKKYGGTVIADRVKQDAAAYDAKTKHGANQGAVLDASIP